MQALPFSFYFSRKLLAHLEGIQTPEITCTETALASHNRETATVRCFSAPEEGLPASAGRGEEPWRGWAEVRPGQAKGTFLLWDVMCS